MLDGDPFGTIKPFPEMLLLFEGDSRPVVMDAPLRQSIHDRYLDDSRMIRRSDQRGS